MRMRMIMPLKPPFCAAAAAAAGTRRSAATDSHSMELVRTLDLRSSTNRVHKLFFGGHCHYRRGGVSSRRRNGSSTTGSCGLFLLLVVEWFWCWCAAAAAAANPTTVTVTGFFLVLTDYPQFSPGISLTNGTVLLFPAASNQTNDAGKNESFSVSPSGNTTSKGGVSAAWMESMSILAVVTVAKNKTIPNTAALWSVQFQWGDTSTNAANTSYTSKVVSNNGRRPSTNGEKEDTETMLFTLPLSILLSTFIDTTNTNTTNTNTSKPGAWTLSTILQNVTLTVKPFTRPENDAAAAAAGANGTAFSVTWAWKTIPATVTTTGATNSSSSTASTTNTTTTSSRRRPFATVNGTRVDPPSSTTTTSMPVPVPYSSVPSLAPSTTPTTMPITLTPTRVPSKSPTKSPTKFPTISPSTLPSFRPSAWPLSASYYPSPVALPSDMPMNYPSNMINYPSSLIPSSIESLLETSSPQQQLNPNNNATVSNTSTTTTAMDPYKGDNCFFANSLFPHILQQCACFNSIQIVPLPVVESYQRILESGIFYLWSMTDNNPNNNITKCTVENQALVWWSSTVATTIHNVTRVQLQNNFPSILQRWTLAVLYFHWKVPTTWIISTNWLNATQPDCTWYGVQCNTNQQVTELQLNSNRVSGTLHPQLMFLSSLQTLSLQRNSMSGTIPTILASLVNLSTLDLSFNQFTGTIPSELSQLSLLRNLFLQGNDLSGTVPATICAIGTTSPTTITIVVDCYDTTTRRGILSCSCCSCGSTQT